MCFVGDLLNEHTITASQVVEIPVNEEVSNVRVVSISNNQGEYLITPNSVIDYVKSYNCELIHCVVEYLHNNGSRSTCKDKRGFFKLRDYASEIFEAKLYFLEDELGSSPRGTHTYNYLCKIVKERDTKCFICGAESIQCHHIFSYKDNPGLQANVGNCISLCPDCHREYHEAFEEVNPYTFLQFTKQKLSKVTANYILDSMDYVLDDEAPLILQSRGGY